MSFSVNFVARTPADAQQRLHRESLPLGVKVIVRDALNAIKTDKLLAIIVKGSGHLPETPTDYAFSSVSLEVTPIFEG